ncbi:hypothetical protein DWB98_13390 (plasmid) [Staphylococcus xylosus]|uniref:hypothetical protein n=1 Tax=Staphylococcus xylosus TaxID=1288 RepID=UPI00118C7293|nr:hypothetical protein [Staphylococcus xylosus]QDW90436.1 hypothetical protein DWB98_13390 [Staphylococcus xylosus]
MIFYLALFVTVVFFISLAIGLIKSIITPYLKNIGVFTEESSYHVIFDNLIYSFRCIAVISLIGSIVLWIVFLISLK